MFMKHVFKIKDRDVINRCLFSNIYISDIKS